MQTACVHVRVCVFRSIQWLQRGSREIFGTVVEDVVYLLIDTSLSMQHHFSFVKEKISLLFQVSHCCSRLRLYLKVFSLRFNGHFPGGPGLAGTRMSPFWI